MKLKSLAISDRPREKLFEHGPESLTATELLSLCLNTGTSKESVLQLSQRILSHFGDLRTIFSSSVEQLMKFPGIGKAKSALIVAIGEVSRRSLAPRDPIKIHGSKTAFDLLHWRVRDLKRERGYMIHLDDRHRVLKIEMLSEGGSQATIFETREIFCQALNAGAKRIIVAHNHPSGDPTPSSEDREVTENLLKAAQILGLPLLDHLIIGDQSYYSFAEGRIQRNKQGI